jgi:hypothetical protein
MEIEKFGAQGKTRKRKQQTAWTNNKVYKTHKKTSVSFVS